MCLCEPIRYERKEANTTTNDPIVSIDFDQENSDEIRTDGMSGHDRNERGRDYIASVWQPHVPGEVLKM